MGDENNNIRDIVEHNHEQDDDEQSQGHGNEEHWNWTQSNELKRNGNSGKLDLPIT